MFEEIIGSFGQYTAFRHMISNGVSFNSTGGSYSKTELRKVAVSVFDARGNKKGCYLLPKKQTLINTPVPPFYLSAQEGTTQKLEFGSQFKSFVYLNGENKRYVLFNDVAANTEKVKEGKIATILGVSGCDGFYYTLEGDEVLPARDFVFDKPGDPDDYNLALFSASDYDKQQNLYVTLKLEKKGRNKGVKLVWMKP